MFLCSLFFSRPEDKLKPLIFVIASKLWILFLLLNESTVNGGDATSKYFTIRIVDDVTGRGVPLVSFTTTSKLQYWSDSNGIVAFFEPGLMNQTVWFDIWSHGYAYPTDWLGLSGTKIQVTEGGNITLTIHRLNIAERLYRVTGQGIYADSLMVGYPIPPSFSYPIINCLVTGQDSVITSVYGNKTYWFWGDTLSLTYGLGNFGTTGATTDPFIDLENGPPNLSYFCDSNGFVRPMIPSPDPTKGGLRWLDAVVTLPASTNNSQKELLVGQFMYIPDPTNWEVNKTKHGLVVWNDTSQQFDIVSVFSPNSCVAPKNDVGGARQASLHTEPGTGKTYVYLGRPFPVLRCIANLEIMKNPENWEGFTCLTEGSRLDNYKIETSFDGRVVWGWKKNTAPVNDGVQKRLLQSGELPENDRWWHLMDPITGEEVLSVAGTLFYNNYRGKYVLVIDQFFGNNSLLGEIWYAESDTIHGPFAYARKIITHRNYSFYNPIHHQNFDKMGGRVIFIEGTFVNTFSGVDYTVPRYEYNNIMYKLDLSDERLVLPSPFYLSTPLTKAAAAFETFRANVLTRQLANNVNYNISKDSGTDNCIANTVAFYAPDRNSSLASYSIYYCPQQNRLVHTVNNGMNCTIAFYGLAPTTNVSQISPLTMVALVESSDSSGNYFYFLQNLDSISPSSSIVCFVWKASASNESRLSAFWWIVIVFIIVVVIVFATFLAIFITRRPKQKGSIQHQSFEYLGEPRPEETSKLQSSATK
jgi:hypothetical protein